MSRIFPGLEALALAAEPGMVQWIFPFTNFYSRVGICRYVDGGWGGIFSTS